MMRTERVEEEQEKVGKGRKNKRKEMTNKNITSQK